MKKIYLLLISSLLFADTSPNMYEGLKQFNKGNYTKANELFKKACEIDKEAAGCNHLYLFTKDASYLQKACDLDPSICEKK